MSQNTDYAEKIARQLKLMPAKAVLHVLNQAVRQVAMMTVQDSGNAAMNWNVTRGGEATPSFKVLYGIGEVGKPGDRRSSGLKGNIMQVVNAQTEKLHGKFPTAVTIAGEKTVVLSNNINNPTYESNAAIWVAGSSITQSLVDAWVKEAAYAS